jgi:cell division protein FtsB
VLIETCDKAIGKENDHLKREAKKLELEVNKLKNESRSNLLKITISMW